MGSRGIVARVAGVFATAAVLATPAPAPAATLVDTCRPLSAPLTPVCRVAQQTTSGVSATCRTLTLASPACRLPATPGWTREEIAAAENGWVARALARQSRLGDDLGFADAPWVSTHNSFNSIAEMGPTLSALDANQQLTLVDQLRIGIRSLELDLHWALDGLRGPVVCHATDPAHTGCTVEKALGQVLPPIRAWLDAHPDQILLLYLENKLDGAAGEAAAVAALEQSLGGRIAKPSEGACTKLPMEGLTRNGVRAAGAQVVIVSNGCGATEGWRSNVFDWRDRDEERPKGFQPFPACGPHTPGLDRLVRYYEDGTALTATASLVGAASIDDGVTPATAKALTDCGVDIVGFDHLVPGDGRLPAVVWSWAPDEPAAAGGCAALRADGRWVARDCAAAAIPAACAGADGSWALSAPTTAVGAAAACAATGRTHATPRTGYEGALLRTAAAGRPAWLAIRRGEPGF